MELTRPEDWKRVPSGQICYGLNYTAADGSQSCVGNLAPTPTYTPPSTGGSSGGGTSTDSHAGFSPTSDGGFSATSDGSMLPTGYMHESKLNTYIAAAPSNAVDDYLVTAPGLEPLPGPRTPYGAELSPPPIQPASKPQIRDGRMSGTLLSMEIDASRSSSARQAIEIAAIRGDNAVRGLFGF